MPPITGGGQGHTDDSHPHHHRRKDHQGAEVALVAGAKDGGPSTISATAEIAYTSVKNAPSGKRRTRWLTLIRATA